MVTSPRVFQEAYVFWIELAYLISNTEMFATNQSPCPRVLEGSLFYCDY